jgi:hypothetical protein
MLGRLGQTIQHSSSSAPTGTPINIFWLVFFTGRGFAFYLPVLGVRGYYT